MSQRTMQLPIRSLVRRAHHESQWTHRRCLATTQSPTPAPPMPPPDDSSLGRSRRPDAEASKYDPSLPKAQRGYTLSKTDWLLKKPLPRSRGLIPTQYLQHSTSELLSPAEKAQREQTVAHRKIVGVVVSSGKMDKTVKVRVPRMEWNKRIKKHFHGHTQHLVHDPNNSLVTGDVISLHRLKVGATVNHVVAEIVSPFSTPVEDRPPIPSADDRLAAYKEKRFRKLQRRSLRQKAAAGDAEAIRALRMIGLDAGKGVAPVGGITSDSAAGTTVTNHNRAMRNKEKAMKFRGQAEDNILEAKDLDEELEATQGITTPSKLPLQNPVVQDLAQGGVKDEIPKSKSR